MRLACLFLFSKENFYSEVLDPNLMSIKLCMRYCARIEKFIPISQ